MNTQLSTTDYSNIAKMILANVPDESKTFEVEFATDTYTVFLEEVYKRPIRRKIAAITRLVACYTKHSQDDKNVKANTLEALAGISGLLETVFAYTEDIALWADFTGGLAEKMANEC